MSLSAEIKLMGNFLLNMTYTAYMFIVEKRNILQNSIYSGRQSRTNVTAKDSIKLVKNSVASEIWGWGKDEST